jgi:hypothetical protein
MDITKKIYNDVLYSQIIKLNFIIKEGGEVTTKVIPNIDVTAINIETSILNSTSSGYIIIVDNGNTRMNRVVADGFSNFEITIKQADATVVDGTESMSDIVNMSHTYLINSIEVITVDDNSTSYKVRIVHSDWYKFNNHLVIGASDKNTSDILKGSFGVNGMKLTRGSTIVDSKISFISPTTYKFIDSIRHIMSISHNINEGPYLINHEWVTGDYTLLDFKQLWKSLSGGYEIPTMNQFYMAGSESIESSAEHQYIVKNMASYTHHSVDVMTEQLKGISEYRFNHINGVTYTDDITPQMITKGIPKPQHTTFNSQYYVTEPLLMEPKLTKRNKTIPQHYDEVYSKALVDILFNTDYIEFDTRGSMLRNAGSIGVISIDPTDPLSTKYRGSWLMTSVIHQFSVDKYKNTITATRSDVGEEYVSE